MGGLRWSSVNSGLVRLDTIRKAKPGTGLLQAGRKEHLVPIDPHQARPSDSGPLFSAQGLLFNLLIPALH